MSKKREFSVQDVDGVDLPSRLTHFREDVDHLWRIHTLVLVLCAIVIYLTASAWTSAPEALSGLKNLKGVLTSLSEEKSGQSGLVQTLVQAQPGAARKNVERVRRDLQACSQNGLTINPKVLKKARRILRSNSQRVLEDGISAATFRDIERQLGNAELELETIGELDPEHIQRMRTWIEERVERGCTKIEVAELEWNRDWQSKVMTFTVVCSDEDIPQQKSSFEVGFTVEATPWSRDAFWREFEEPRSWIELNELDKTSLDDAIGLASASLTLGLDDKQQIGPFHLESAHLGVVAPPTILFLLAYLLIHATALAERLRGFTFGQERYLRAASRWLPLMDGMGARVASVLALLVVPSAAVGLPIWRLTSMEFGHAVVIGGVAFGLGTMTLVVLRRSPELVEKSIVPFSGAARDEPLTEDRSKHEESADEAEAKRAQV